MIHASQNQLAGERRFQFSLRLLLIFTAVAAVLVAISLSIYRHRAAGHRAMLFRQAVQNGDFEAVDQLLKNDSWLAHGLRHGSARSSHTALQQALNTIRTYSVKVVDRILEENPDVNETSSGGETALHIAARLNHVSEVQRLLQLGADVNAMDERGNTPLSMAVRANNRTGQLLKLLLDAGADPNVLPPGVPGTDWKPPLHLAAESGNTVILAHLLDAGAQVNTSDMQGRTALHLAATDDHRGHNVCTLLVQRGADLTAKDEQGLIPGEFKDGANSGIAALLWWEHIVQLFDNNDLATLDRLLNAAPQALSFRLVYEPKTMLHRAMAAKRLDLLDYLLAHLPNPLRQNLEQLPPLHEACWRSTPVQKAKDLLDAGANVNVRDPFGQTPLHAAAREHNHDVLRLLLARGADVHARDTAGATVLDTAFERSFHREEALETLELLIQAGHPPTVLYAAAIRDLKLLQELTRDDATLLDRVYTRTGVRPLHAAVMGNQPDVIEWLFGQGVEREPFIRPHWGVSHKETPLMRALSYDLTDIAILLIDHGTDVNRKSAYGYYPIHAALDWDRDPKILEALLAHGADPTFKYEDKTAADLAKAAKSKHRDRYLELLLDAETHKSAAGR